MKIGIFRDASFRLSKIQFIDFGKEGIHCEKTRANVGNSSQYADASAVERMRQC